MLLFGAGGVPVFLVAPLIKSPLSKLATEIFLSSAAFCYAAKFSSPIEPDSLLLLQDTINAVAKNIANDQHHGLST